MESDHRAAARETLQDTHSATCEVGLLSDANPYKQRVKELQRVANQAFQNQITGSDTSHTNAPAAKLSNKEPGPTIHVNKLNTRQIPHIFLIYLLCRKFLEPTECHR